MSPRPGATPWVVAALIACCAAASTGCGGAAPTAAVGGRTPSNLEVMRTLVAAISGTVLDSAGRSMGDTVLIDVDSWGISWVARTEIAALLGEGKTRSGWPGRSLLCSR